MYNSHYAGENEVPGSTIYSFLGVLLGTWAFSAFFFFYKIKRRYWSTFYSTNTGCQLTMSYFLGHVDDATKSLVFARHIDHWKKIAKEVKAWTLANWRRWEEEKPEWFTEHFKESVPDEFIPKMSLEELNKKGGGERRRSSAFAGNAALPSIRRSSVALVSAK